LVVVVVVAKRIQSKYQIQSKFTKNQNVNELNEGRRIIKQQQQYKKVRRIEMKQKRTKVYD